MLGLNPMEQEIVDLTNTITRNGFIYFPDFCKIVLTRWREADENVFRQHMFKVLIYDPIMNNLNLEGALDCFVCLFVSHASPHCNPE